MVLMFEHTTRYARIRSFDRLFILYKPSDPITHRLFNAFT